MARIIPQKVAQYLCQLEANAAEYGTDQDSFAENSDYYVEEVFDQFLKDFGLTPAEFYALQGQLPGWRIVPGKVKGPIRLTDEMLEEFKDY